MPQLRQRHRRSSGRPAAPRSPPALKAPALEGRRGSSGAFALPDNVVMPSHQPGGAEPDAGQPRAGRPVELLGDLDRPRAWVLVAGGVPQSHVDLYDPGHLELEYMRRLGHMIDLAAPVGEIDDHALPVDAELMKTLTDAYQSAGWDPI